VIRRKALRARIAELEAEVALWRERCGIAAFERNRARAIAAALSERQPPDAAGIARPQVTR
jgi:hypothetical protein